MKKKIFLVITAAVLISVSTFANVRNEIIPASINANFGRHFAGATEVSWEKKDAFYKASFNLYGTTFFAYYGDDTRFVALTHNLLSDKLPLMLQAELKMKYASYWITDLVEYTAHHESGYSVTLEGRDHTIVLRSNNLNGWYIYKQVNKD